jgi:two-component system chemotaxis response regulator CheB
MHVAVALKEGHMQPHPIDIVAIGASAGGIQALSKLLRLLPADLPATVLVTVHRPVARDSQLQQVLASANHLPVVIAKQGERLHGRKCYMGTPSLHLTVGPGLVARLVHDGFYRGHNIDLLFGSLARNAGPRTVGVLLSGLLKDGSQGLAALKEAAARRWSRVRTRLIMRRCREARSLSMARST